MIVTKLGLRIVFCTKNHVKLFLYQNKQFLYKINNCFGSVKPKPCKIDFPLVSKSPNMNHNVFLLRSYGSVKPKPYVKLIFFWLANPQT